MIRRIGIKDKEQYLDLSRQFWSSDKAALHSIPEGNIQRTFDLLMAENPYADCYVYEQEGALVGYILLARTYSNEAGGYVLWIEELFIRPECQGMGLGSELIAFIENLYKNKVVRIRLEATSSNIKAIDLYRRLGFADLEYKQFYKDC